MRDDLALQLQGYRLTTAHILYHLPDHPAFLQSFTWQNLDMAPAFPRLRHFLDFWQREIEGALHSVTVGSTQLIKPAELRVAGLELRLH
ncbi:usg protein [Radicibacter daui]|uniref:usg protein n=1 Tax=Radicibacter daui TaxID=3064829 RepID=UPI004046A37A